MTNTELPWKIPKYVAEIELTQEELTLVKWVLWEEKNREECGEEAREVIAGLLGRLSLKW